MKPTTDPAKQSPSSYTWFIGMELSSNRELQTNKPLAEHTVLIDLFDGHRYIVRSICPASARDKVWAFLPNTALHTQAIEPLPNDELAKFRKRANYSPNELCGPLGDIVFE